MAKKQSRRSVSLSKTTYERLKAYCETADISMSQFVETRIGDFLGRSATSAPVTVAKSAPVRGATRTESEPAPAPGKKVDEGAAKRAAERIFTF